MVKINDFLMDSNSKPKFVIMKPNNNDLRKRDEKMKFCSNLVTFVSRCASLVSRRPGRTRDLHVYVPRYLLSRSC